MARRELSVFLASPMELRKDRIYIGSTIGLLNTYYDELGKYITLNKWEDYRASYVGGRTQTAYNEELLRPSDVVIILLYHSVGQYTIEEFEEAAKLKKRIIVAIRVDDSPEYKIPEIVYTFALQAIQIEGYSGTWIYKSAEELNQKLTAFIESELGQHNFCADGIDKDFCCYLSFTKMLQFAAEEVRDKVRAFDTQRRAYGQKCLMFPFRQKRHIPNSWYNYCVYYEEPEDSVNLNYS